MPKRWQNLSKDELREVHLALTLRILELSTTDTRKMDPNAKTKLKRNLDLCTELDDALQKSRGK